MVRMVSAIANGGVLMEPRIVKQIIDNSTGEVQNIEPKEQSRAISEETANQVLSMMETVVADGTGRNAQVKGYRIGGKTGTSEDGVNTISDPEVVILITLYNPTGQGGHQGGGVAAPIASQVLGELLPALEIAPDNREEIDIKQAVIVPEIREKTLKEALEILKEAGLDAAWEGEVDKETEVVSDQLPKPGLSVNEGTKVEISF